MNMIGSPLLLFVFLAAEDKPVPKFPVGKETTYVTGPLDKDGYIDYQAALNDRLGKEITPEKNANVLFWKALGPIPEDSSGMPAEFFKRLGIEEPPPKGNYFVGLRTYARDKLKLAEATFDSLIDLQRRATQRPWEAKDNPHIAAWLKVNETPLAIVIEATRRSNYFNPLVSHATKKGQNWSISILGPDAWKCRELAIALAARAMLKVREDKFDAAWQDLLACHRLARLVGQGGTVNETHVGFIFEEKIAQAADLAYLDRAKLTSKQVQDCLKDLQALPPFPPMADKIDLAERFVFLETFQIVRRGGVRMLEKLFGEEAEEPSEEELKALEMIDWELALRSGNRWYDRLVAATRHKERADREKELEKFDADLAALKKEITKPAGLAKLLLEKGQPNKTTGMKISDFLIDSLLSNARKMQRSYDQVEQVQRNLHVAFALAAYHADNGRYPAKLDDLAPKYLASVPNDLFSAKPLIYRPEEKGYLFYSVGDNGKDDGGRWRDDDPPGDDLSVRMPLPELKPKK